MTLAWALPIVFAAAGPGAPPSPTPALFAAHREALLSRLPKDAIAVFRSAPESTLEVGDTYRQDSDFWYLTGLSEPDAVAVFRPGTPDASRYVLFVRPKDFAAEQWTGWRTGIEAAKAELGAGDAHPVAEFSERFRQLAAGAKTLFFRDGGDVKFREQLFAAWNSGDTNATAPRPLADAGPIVHQMRLVKDAAEQALMREAARLSAEAHRAAMAATRAGRYEYVLKAAMLGHCLANGAARMAYPPIVGSGPNSVVLHYERDDRKMEAGDMIVNDTGCEYAMYAADVTRSYPVSGRFSPEQKAIYEVVLAAQKAAMEKVRPGTLFREVHTASVDVVVDGLLRLGILTGDRERILKERTYQKFYPHGCSHWIGLNVHDAGSYGYPEGVDRRERYGKAMTKLEPGMALTVEPGIYIPEGSTNDKKWWNLGVRVEDTVLVTPGGMECLSCAAPRELSDVERAIAGAK
jgi:Xaa-Pro aminopeptidase